MMSSWADPERGRLWHRRWALKDRQNFSRQKNRWEQGMLRESVGIVRKQEVVSFGWSARYVLKSSRSQSEGVFGPWWEDVGASNSAGPVGRGSRKAKVKGSGGLPCCPASISHLVLGIGSSALSGSRDFPSLLSVLATRLSGACNNGFPFWNQK